MEDLSEYGIETIRMRNDRTTQSDFKNVIIVWSLQFILAFYVVFSTSLPLADIYEV